MFVSCLSWVLGTKLGSSERAVCELNYEVSSPASRESFQQSQSPSPFSGDTMISDNSGVAAQSVLFLNSNKMLGLGDKDLLGRLSQAPHNFKKTG